MSVERLLMLSISALMAVSVSCQSTVDMTGQNEQVAMTLILPRLQQIERQQEKQLMLLQQLHVLLERISCHDSSSSGRRHQPKECPDGFERLSSDVPSCYKMVSENLNWSDAAMRCKTLNPRAHLIVIDDAKETNLMKNMSKQGYWHLRPCGRYAYPHNDTIAFWTAGQRIDPTSESRFVWKISANTTKELTYTNWSPSGEPNFKDNNESCVHMYYWHADWNDNDCAFQSCSVCEIDI